MTKEQLLISKLKAYEASNVYPLHMPGHKRQLSQEIQREFPNPFLIDITEIDGFDNLHHPEGILQESMEWASGVYGTDQTYYLVNGSSCGVLSAICAGTHVGGKILMSRNCHKSAYHGIILNRLRVEYVYPQIIEELGIQGGISPQDVEKELKNDSEIEAILIVSPTYDGIVSDIEEIAKIAHQYKVPLIVDEAHGAHFPFGNGRDFPVSALNLGADLVIQSLHKTLPSFTQTAVLHRNGCLVEKEKLEYYLQIFQTSSPSYVFMAGIEQCIFEMSEHGASHMESFGMRLQKVRETLGGLKRLRVVDRSCVGKAGVFDVDLSKLVVSCRSCSFKGVALDGEQLGIWLREQYHLEVEMCGADYIVAIMTYLDTEEGWNRFVNALLEIDEQLEEKREMGEPENRQFLEVIPEQKLCLADAKETDYEICPLEACVGRISGEFVYLYPPGIPIVTPGEVLTDVIVKQIMDYKKMCLPIQGMADKNVEFLRVLKWEKSFI